MKSIWPALVTGLSLALASCGGDDAASSGADAAVEKPSKPAASRPAAASEEPDLPGDLALLVGEMEAQDEFVRVEAVMKMAAAEGKTHPAVQKAFREALEDESTDVRAEAAKALPRVLGDEAGELLAPLLQDEEVTIRRAAIEGLSSTGDPEAAVLIARCLQDEESAVQLQALHAVTRLKNPAVLDEVKVMLFDPDGTKICAAIAAVVALDGKSEIETMRGLLNDMNTEVRSRAAEALGSLGASDKDSLVALSRLLTDEMEGVRKSASESLTGLTGAKVEYYYDEADQESLKRSAKLWADWIEKNK